MKQTCILVLGMHRSGTSALTGTLGMLDVYLGGELLKANFANEKGYFENDVLYKVNENLLDQIDSSWDDTFYNENKLVNIEELDTLKTTIMSEFGTANLFAIKDPRLAFLFPVYKKVLDELNIDIKIILPYRNPAEVANSLQKRDGMPLEKGMLLWAYHFLLAEKFSRKYDRVFVGFDELMSESAKTIESISSKLHIKLDDKYQQNKEKINEFLEPSLKHHNISMEDATSKPPKIIRDILTLKEKFNEADLVQEFDELRYELFSYQELFYNDSVLKSLNKEQELTKTKATLHVKEQELTKTKATLHVKEQELNSLKTELTNIYTSKSWKITRPLRIIMRKLRR